jgi:uncharacterized protein YeaO (DUF488 family)
MISIVQLGSPRQAGECPRIGTVRRPPRGVREDDFARLDYYDVCFPNLSPSAEFVQEALAAETPKAWAAFVRKFRHEMSAPDRSREARRARRAVASQQLLGGVLLRGREPLPLLGPPRATYGPRRGRALDLAQPFGGGLRRDVPLRAGQHLVSDEEFPHRRRAQQRWIEMRVEVELLVRAAVGGALVEPH